MNSEEWIRRHGIYWQCFSLDCLTSFLKWITLSKSCFHSFSKETYWTATICEDFSRDLNKTLNETHTKAEVRWEAPLLSWVRRERGSRSVVSDSLRPHGLCAAHGVLAARILEWVAFPFSRRSSQPRNWTQGSHTAGGFFTSWATREAQKPFCFDHV